MNRTKLKRNLADNLIAEYKIVYGDNYGIGITVYRNGICEDSIIIHDICIDALEIERIIMVLFVYAVTPVTAYDVLDVYFDDPERFSNLFQN